MSNKKQTSIDWLFEKLCVLSSIINNPIILEQAKAMHREEIEEAYFEGAKDVLTRDYDDPKKYFEQTFKN